MARGERQAFAQAIGTTLGHLNNMACGQAQVSPLYAAQIEVYTKGAVPRSETRPDDCHLIWPPGLLPIAVRPQSSNDERSDCDAEQVL